ncbi:MAG: conjugal transfer protein TraF [Pseudomonadota bacterium]
MPARRIARGALALILAATPVAAQDTRPDTVYCGERKLGRYFYCDRIRPEKPEPPEVTQGVSSRSRTATQEVEAIREELEELRAEAVLRPSTESVSAYIRFQREQLDRASLFSDHWRRALWMDPTLDYNLERPVSGVSKRAWLDTRKVDRRELLASLGERYGVFYFYAASCSACTEFSPILREFADIHGISVKAVSVDGGPSPHFPNAVIDQGEMAKLGLGSAPTPAVALFDTETRQVTPIAFGVVAQSELEERIFVLTQMTPGEDY